VVRQVFAHELSRDKEKLVPHTSGKKDSFDRQPRSACQFSSEPLVFKATANSDT
jgi:hypothetical protein